MKAPTPKQVRFVRAVRSELNRYMQNPLAKAKPGFLKRDAARFRIESKFPEYFTT